MRTCLTCGNELVKKSHESNPRFAKRRFDSDKCARAWMKANRLGWWAEENAGNHTLFVKKEVLNNG